MAQASDLCVFSAIFLLFIFMFTGRRHALDRWEGLLCFVLYTGYISVLRFQVL